MKYVSDVTEATDFTVTELRVHGVGGSSPEALVGVPHVNRVAGTQRAGFYRSPAWISLDGPKRNLEGYSWGGITSSSVFRALWILLLPFALINLVGWMFPHAGSASHPIPRSRKDVIVAGLFRMLALTSTLAVGAFVAIIGIEIVGVRCVLKATCGGAWYLLPWRWVGANATHGVAIGAVVAVGFVLALAFVARMGQARKSEIDLDRTTDPAYQTTLVGSHTGQPFTMWERPDVADRLGLAHTSGAIVLVGLMTIEAIRSLTGQALVPQLSLLLVLAAVVLLFVWDLPLASSRQHRILLLLVGLALAWTVYGAWTARPGSLSQSVLTWSPLVVFTSFGATFLVTGVWAVLARSADDSGKSLDRILLLYPALLLIIAVWGGVLGVAVSVLDIIHIEGLADFTLTITNRFALVGIGWLLGAVLGIVVLRLRQIKRGIDEVVDDYTRSTDGIGDAELKLEIAGSRDLAFIKRVRGAEATAALTDKIGGILLGGFLGSLGPLVWVLWTLLSAQPIDGLPYEAAFYEGFAGKAVVVLPVIGVALIGWMIRDPSARRGFGIIWDVSTFWPRWFHPWAPPAYGEFAVPHLRLRVEGLVEANERVILSTHSQGSVLGAAALAVLDPTVTKNVRWVTHGCPLNRLYATYFPEYFDVELFESIRSKLRASDRAPAWVNLWRRTDYIGGPVLPAVDQLVFDPESADTVLSLDPRPKPLRHSNFYITHAYSDRLIEFVGAFGDG